MTIESMFTKEFYDKYGDVDIINDVTDDMAPAFCGTLLTDAGKDHFAEVLQLEVNMIETEYNYAEIKVDVPGEDSDAWEDRWDAVYDLFAAAAGYCTDSEWDAWFKTIKD